VPPVSRALDQATNGSVAVDGQANSTGGDGLFQIRGQLHTLLTLRLIAPNDHRFFPKLQSAISLTPVFFSNAPVVLDAAPVADQLPPNLAEFARRLRQQHLVPVGIQNGSEDWNRAAVNAGLGVLPAPSGARKQATSAQEPPPPPSAEVAAAAGPDQQPGPTSPRRGGGPSLLVTEPVRAGQQIYAEGGDLVVLAPVSPGAEVLADGHIHVYGPLRGRAHAGLSGDEGARVFCQSLEAQLVSIAGYYLVNDEIEARFLKQRVQARCAERSIVIERLP
jgi:septum site-determining protein MinC